MDKLHRDSIVKYFIGGAGKVRSDAHLEEGKKRRE